MISVTGVNQTAALSAMRCNGALLPCALRTSSTMRRYWLSPAIAVAFMVSGPSTLELPDSTVEPTVTGTASGSPVIALAST